MDSSALDAALAALSRRSLCAVAREMGLVVSQSQSRESLLESLAFYRSLFSTLTLHGDRVDAAMLAAVHGRLRGAARRRLLTSTAPKLPPSESVVLTVSSRGRTHQADEQRS